MPKRTDIKSIMIIGAGPIIIGQACEFDYSGTQACKALKEDGYRIILVNSNPATIMTDPDLADATYIEPITPEIVAKIIEKERPCALLPTVGGQTALNCALELDKMGVLEKFQVKMIGAQKEAIEKAENRQLFKEAMARIGLECPKNSVVHSVEEALNILDYVGLPAIIRPSFTMGGTGGGIAYTREQFIQIVESGLDASPTTEVLIDESVLGWKEYEMEVVRDSKDNCIIICSIENIDPMGTHTGDSITVAPALTLTDKEYQIMRDASVAVLREIGVDTGGSNVQFAVNPENGKMVVIEMNPRVSRSSALASKATGFPIAKVAAKLAVGYSLDEIMNDCTKVTPASFEPVIDYVVTKIPRFTFEKFKGADNQLSSAMKSVGEAMAIGRSFAESFQKALRSMETGLTGLDEVENFQFEELEKLLPNRILTAAEAFRRGHNLKEIHAITKFDPWFLEQIEYLVQVEKDVRKNGIKDLRALKQLGFSDARIGKLIGKSPKEIRQMRFVAGVMPVYKRVDTCAAEFESATSYMYSTYEDECESFITDKKKVVILGGGPNRIGQGIEFDYACVHAAYSLRDAGYETIMVNCNPETVSTDYDTSDRLYFEPLTEEDVINLILNEQKKGEVIGVNVQFGGQTPLKLAKAIEEAGIPIIGTSTDSIDLAEDRARFQQMLKKLGLKQPANDMGYSAVELREKALKLGFPIVVRPSYVLGGRAMAVVHDEPMLTTYLEDAKEFLSGGILLDSFLNHAIEVDVDAIADGEDVYIAGVMEHIEEAGVHSGDSACSLPPYSLSAELIAEIEDQTRKMALELKVKGLMNVQYAIKDGEIFVLEVNPRASRTAPFVAKATGVPIVKIASLIMVGEKLASFSLKAPIHNHVAVKEAVFPFARFSNADVILGPEMKSTGEVMGIDRGFGRAFAKAQLGAGNKIPLSGTIFISVKDEDKKEILESAKELLSLGYTIMATRGTARFLENHGVKTEVINKVSEGSPHIIEAMRDGKVQLLFNTTEGKSAVDDSFSIRRTALLAKIPYNTTIAGCNAFTQAIKVLKKEGGLEVESIQGFF